MAQLLVEILSEEIPSSQQAKGAHRFKEVMTAFFREKGILCNDGTVWYTPRRTVLYWDDIKEVGETFVEEIKGPALDAPEAAVQGFLKKIGKGHRDDCDKVEIKGKTFLMSRTVHQGLQTKDLITEALDQGFQKGVWSQSMRLGATGFSWIRPLQDIFVLWNKDVLPITLEMKGFVLRSSGCIAGHRVLGKDTFVPQDVAAYHQGLEERFVIVDQEKRKERIVQGLKAHASQHHMVLQEDAGLLDEVTGLVEYPEVYLGQIPERFMSLPAEVLTTSMRVHQKYFSFMKEGRIAPFFAVVAGLTTDDHGAAIIKGNTRVLEARLEDAVFFYKKDQQHDLMHYRTALKEMNDFSGLGTVFDKSVRLSHTCKAIKDAYFPSISDEDATLVGALAKADLATFMVGEFPELQGIMGGYYVKHANQDVGLALREQYQPLSQQGAVPHAPLSIVLALADKVDRLVGFWMVGEKPTGSKDPYALRRSAIGLLRILLDNKMDCGVRDVLRMGFASHQDTKLSTSWADQEACIIDLCTFVMKRFEQIQKDQGVRHDVMEAVLNSQQHDNVHQLNQLCQKLMVCLETRANDVQHSIALTKRFVNMARSFKGAAWADEDAAPSPDQFETEIERKVVAVLGEIDQNNATQYKQMRIEDLCHAHRVAKQVADIFFDEVTIITDDALQTQKRKELILYGCKVLRKVIDFSVIE